MRESTTYQYIFEEGRVEGQVKALQRTLLRQGSRRFGEPDEATQTLLRAITTLDRLDRLVDQVQLASSWQELLQTP